MDEELLHFGVKGMRWGKRKSLDIRTANTNFKKKADAISKNMNADSSDRDRMNYAKKSFIAKATKTATTAAIQTVVMDLITGKDLRSPDYLRKTALRVASGTAKTMATKEALARSAAKRYDDNGKKKKGVKSGLLTKEDKIELGLQAAMQAAPLIKGVLATKAYNTASTRAANERRFNSWGANILQERVSNVIWQSPDLSTAVIDNR